MYDIYIRAVIKRLTLNDRMAGAVRRKGDLYKALDLSTPFYWQREFLPLELFLCVHMLGRARVRVLLKKQKI